MTTNIEFTPGGISRHLQPQGVQQPHRALSIVRARLDLHLELQGGAREVLPHLGRGDQVRHGHGGRDGVQDHGAVDAAVVEEVERVVQAKEGGLRETNLISPKGGDETVSSRKKGEARQDETVSISSRLVTLSRETVSSEFFCLGRKKT